ncbi:139_t:CDS:1, partial [Funneliformis geosporum]
GSVGYNEIRNLLEDNKWGSREDESGTTAYILMEDNTKTYQVSFI